MNDAPTLYDQDDETIERVINEECAAAMRSHIAELDEQLARQNVLLDECRLALEHAAPIVRKWCHTQGNNKQFHADTIAPINAALAKLRGDAQ